MRGPRRDDRVRINERIRVREVRVIDETGAQLGIMAPAGTPRAIVDRLNAEITKAANAPEMREAWARQGATAMSMGADEFGRFMREDIDKWSRIVKISGARPDR